MVSTSALTMRKWRAANPILNMVCYVRERAQKYNIKFALTQEDILAAWPRDNRCAVCRKKMLKNTSTAPSVDRRNNRLGYVPSNIGIICRRCNMAKSDFDAKRLWRLALYAEGRL